MDVAVAWPIPAHTTKGRSAWGGPTPWRAWGSGHPWPAGRCTQAVPAPRLLEAQVRGDRDVSAGCPRCWPSPQPRAVFGRDPVDGDSVRRTTASCIKGMALMLPMSGKVGEATRRAWSAPSSTPPSPPGALYGEKVSEARRLSTELDNEGCGGDRGSGSGFDTKVERARSFAAQMGLQAFALETAAIAAVATMLRSPASPGSPRGRRRRHHQACPRERRRPARRLRQLSPRAGAATPLRPHHRPTQGYAIGRVSLSGARGRTLAPWPPGGAAELAFFGGRLARVRGLRCAPPPSERPGRRVWFRRCSGSHAVPTASSPSQVPRQAPAMRWRPRPVGVRGGGLADVLRAVGFQRRANVQPARAARRQAAQRTADPDVLCWQ